MSISHNWVSFFGAKVVYKPKICRDSWAMGEFLRAFLAIIGKQICLYFLKDFCKGCIPNLYGHFCWRIKIFLQFMPIVNVGMVSIWRVQIVFVELSKHYMPLTSDRWAHDHISFITFMFDWEVSFRCHTITFRNYNSFSNYREHGIHKTLNSFPYQVAQPLFVILFCLFCSCPQIFRFFQFCDVVNRDNLPYNNLAKFGYKHYTNVKAFQHPSHFCYMH